MIVIYITKDIRKIWSQNVLIHDEKISLLNYLYGNMFWRQNFSFFISLFLLILYKIWITYFDSKFFPVFFNYFMKYYLLPQNSIHFKNQLIEIYKMVWFLGFKNFNLSVVLKISKFYNFFLVMIFFKTTWKLNKF